jgi:AraC family transcriptional regulator
MPESLIVAKPELTVVGMRRSFIHALSPDTNNVRVIGGLWGEFLERAAGIPDRVGQATYGVLFARPAGQRSHQDELEYIAAVAVSSTSRVPAGMVARTIPAGTFAVFLHRGPIKNIADTCRAIYRDWLPSSPYEHSGLADIELYDHRFCADSDESEMEYWISIRPKAPGSDQRNPSN